MAPLATEKPEYGEESPSAAPYALGPGVARAARTHRYERRPGDPITRPLRIFTLDPSLSELDGAIATIAVPYEPLTVTRSGAAPCFEGRLMRIVSVSGADGTGEPMPAIDLDDPRVLIGGGVDPSPTDYRFHQQMVYAVASSVYDRFRVALGRDLAWGFDPEAGESEARLVVYPHVPRVENAFYDKAAGSLSFGACEVSALRKTHRRLWPGAQVFTCLSHDVVAHEMTHALVDGLRCNFSHASNADVPAFHEALADLVAIFQKFSYTEVLRRQLERTRFKLEHATLLVGLARELGYMSGSDGGIRTAIDPSTESPQAYDPKLGEHELGRVLVSAIFEAFDTVYRRKIDRFIRIATDGSGVLRDGNPSPALLDVLVDEAAKLARQFQTLVIRALDYCPPVDVTFGEYLRALITSDVDLIAVDKWGFREALIDAFTRRRIYPPEARTLSVDALVWRAPRYGIAALPTLSFRDLAFDGDPSRPAGHGELLRQAHTLGAFVTRAENLQSFGLRAPGKYKNREGLEERYERVEVESVRTARRVGPDGRVVFDLVAEIVQRRRVPLEDGRIQLTFLGGATILIDAHGQVRLAIVKRTDHDGRLDRQIEFVTTSGHWIRDPDTKALLPREDMFLRLHQEPRS